MDRKKSVRVNNVEFVFFFIQLIRQSCKGSVKANFTGFVTFVIDMLMDFREQHTVSAFLTKILPPPRRAPDKPANLPL